jgi:tetratricopeptide (TPR) repeat protein
MRGLLVVLVLAAAGAPAFADRETDELLAQELFVAGEKKFAAGDYRGAIAAFMSADLLVPSAIYAFDIAVCHERLGNAEQAVRYYRSYLRRDPRAVTYRTAQQRIAFLEGAGAPRLLRPSGAPLCEPTHPDLRDPLPPNGGAAEVTIVSQPPRAAVYCHGKRLGETPLRVAVKKSRATRLVVARRGYAAAVLRTWGERALEQPVLERLARVHPDLKDPSADVR